MSRIGEIRSHPTSLLPEDIEKCFANKKLPHISFTCSGWHESLLRSYHIVKYIQSFLVANPSIQDTSILLDIIGYLESRGSDAV